MKRIINSEYTNETVMDVLRREGIYIKADCGAKVHCGKCWIKYLSEAPEPNAVDKRFLSEEDLADGMRLSCGHLVKGETEIEIPEDRLVGDVPYEKVPVEEPSSSEIIAVNYGIMMVTGALVDLNQGIIRKASCVSKLRAYGRTLRAKIQSSTGGYGEEMRHLAMDDLSEISERLGRDPEKTRYIIAAPTALQHILSGFPCEGFLKQPYAAVDTEVRRDGNMTMLPCAGPFAGASLLAGILASNLDTSGKPFLYFAVDAGLEMAVGNGKDIIASYSYRGVREIYPSPFWKVTNREFISDIFENLIERAGLKPEDIENVVVSSQVETDPENISGSGILPEPLSESFSLAGDAGLTGASLYVLDTGFGRRLSALAGKMIEFDQ